MRPSSQQVDDPDAVNDIGSAQQEVDEEYDLDVVRSVYEAPPAPEGMAPLYELTDDGQLPGGLRHCGRQCAWALYKV